MTTSRYSQLVASLPKGPFYDSDGTILPYRSDPYQFRFEGAQPNTQYGVYLNDAVQPVVVTTDSNGVAVVTVQLPQGRTTLTLLNGSNAQPFVVTFTVRATATWHAAYADVTEQLDSEIEDAYNARQIQTCPSLYLEPLYGNGTFLPNPGGYSTRTYRNALEDVRQAFRHYAGINRGLRLGVETITSSVPLLVPDNLRPQWILGSSLFDNANLQQYTRVSPALYAVAGLDLPVINASSLSWIASGVLDHTSQPAIVITNQPPFPQKLSVTFSASWTTTDSVNITGTVAGGNTVVEAVTAGSTPATRETDNLFVNVISISVTVHSGDTAGTATVGVSASRAVKIISFNSIVDPDAGGYTFQYTASSPPTLAFFISSGSPYLPVQLNKQTTVASAIQDADFAPPPQVLIQPPVPQNLDVFVTSGWTGATLTIVGTNPKGQVISETVSPVAGQFIPTLNVFATITSIVRDVNHLISAATAEVVLQSDSAQFYTISGIGVFSRIEGNANTATVFNLNPVAGNVCDQTDHFYLYDSISGLSRTIDLSGSGGTPSTIATDITAGSVAASAVTGTGGINTIFLAITLMGTTFPAELRIDNGPCDATRQILKLPYIQSSILTNFTATTIALQSGDGALFPTPDKTGLYLSYDPGSLPISGVFLTSASTSTTLGRGTLAITTLNGLASATWTAPTESVGAAVNGLERGGTFTLSSSTSTSILTITVNRATFAPYLFTNATTSADVDVLSATCYKIRVRGRRTGNFGGGPTGTISAPSGFTCTFTASSLAFLPSDVGNAYVRISDDAANGPAGSPNNNGIHKIVGYTSSTVVTLLNANAADNSPFTASAGVNWAVWTLGSTFTVINRTGDVLTTMETTPITFSATPAALVEPVTEFPITSKVQNLDGSPQAVIEFNPEMLPSAGSDSIVIDGVDVPDGWQTATDVVGQTVTAENEILETGPIRLLLSRTQDNAVTEVRLFHNIPNALAYVGYQIRVNFWVEDYSNLTPQFRIDVSTDNGATYTNGSNQSTDVAGRTLLGYPGSVGTGLLPNAPQCVSRTFSVPHGATGIYIRLTRPLGISGDPTPPDPVYFTVDRCEVVSLTGSGLFTGIGTVPRSDERTFFEELLYVWSKEQLTFQEDRVLGVPQTVGGVLPSQPDTSALGLIDYLTPAHAFVERFDVSENIGDTASNVVGCTFDNEWLNANLTNVEMAPGTPAALSYIRPTRLSQVSNEVITISGITFQSSNLAQLPYIEGAVSFPANPDGKTTLTEVKVDGTVVPIPDTVDANSIQPWQWFAGSPGQVQVDPSYFNPTSTYLVSYPVVLQAGTPITVPGLIQLPSNRADYTWYPDVAIWTQANPRQVSVQRTQQLQILTNFTSRLDQESDQVSTATLFVNNGLTVSQLAATDWSYQDGFTLKINSSVFDPTAVYSFAYTALDMEPDLPVQYKVEHRYATSSGALAGASYEVIYDNRVQEGVDGSGNPVAPIDKLKIPIAPTDLAGTVPEYHQMRITLFNVIDVRTVRVYGLGLVGVHVRGSPYAPGLVE